MKQTERITQTYILWFLDMLCILGAYLLATHLRFAGPQDWGDKTLHYLVGVLFLLAATAWTFLSDANRDFLRRGDYRELIAVFRMHVVILPVTLTLVYFLRWSWILSRSVIGNFAWMSFALMLAVHLLYKRILRRLLYNNQVARRILIVTQENRLEATLRRLRGTTDADYRVVAAACVEPAEAELLLAETEEAVEAIPSGHTAEGIPLYTGAAGLTRKLTQLSFDEVFVALPDIPQRCAAALIRRFEEMGVVCHYTLDFPDIVGTESSVGTFGDYSVVSYSRYREDDARFLVKRLMDIAGGLLGTLLTLLLAVFIAPAIKLDSPGPVFFSQIRVGKNGRRFAMYKFRSMVQDAEAKRGELEEQNEMRGPMFKLENDPRVTRVGRFLRKTSLDEFPQFWNVLRGDMSLVGTRPPTEEEFEQYNEHYRRRISFKPGLTGLWQISGRSDISDFEEVVRLDLEYIDHFSLSRDVKILLQTILAVGGGRGAR